MKTFLRTSRGGLAALALALPARARRKPPN